MYEPGDFQWWWEHTKSERAAKLIEAYWTPAAGGNVSLKILQTRNNPKHQVQALKKPLHRMGYQLRWRVQGDHIIAWVKPLIPEERPGPLILPPGIVDQNAKKKKT